MGSLVSLVMSDIVGSTRRWAADDTAMAADLEVHDRLIADVVTNAGGRVFKHTGDGMIAVFDDPVAAVGAAAGIQRAVGDSSWRQADGLQVRAAVHSGVVYERDGDMFGTAVNKVARILAACPPGAVLVSNAVAGLLAERAPEGVGVRAVGEVALVGFTAPEVVHALTGAGLEAVGSAPSAAGSIRRGGDLPPIDEELVGRVDELAAIWEALGRTRLVTLVGVGGMGKTRLALEVAAGGVDSFEGGVWWVDLATATSPDAVPSVVMAAVGARETPGRTTVQAICDRFTDQRALVVVDNCEHVLGAARDVVTAVRAAAPDVRIVATSREALGVRGEHLVPIGSLPGGDGVALFVERAVAVRPDLDVVADRPVIERLCARLDGIPLAIELAAARCRSMDPAEVDARLDDRFRLLRGGRAGAERHRTLQAAVAWSYELLDPDERHVFLHLAVFAGGTLIDGLASVCDVDELDALDIVDRLIARSMVVPTRSPHGTRYSQLETLRQFAEDRLVELGTIDEARGRHLVWARRLAGRVGADGGTPRAGEAFRRFCAEVDNLRVAVAHAMATDQQHIAHQIAAAVTVAAFERPMFDLFDRVRPIELDGAWTDAAAVCAVGGALADALRGRRPDDGPVGGVPDELFTANPLVQILRGNFEVYGRGRWRAALDLMAGIPVRSDQLRVGVDCVWLAAHVIRHLRMGMSADGAIDDVEFGEIHQRAAATLGIARRLGDELALGRFTYTMANLLIDRYPDDAVALTAEAMEIAERLGADALFDYASSASHQAVLRRIGQHAADETVALAITLRAAIERSMRGLFIAAFSYSSAALGLIAQREPDVATTVVAAWRLSTDVADFGRLLERAGVPEPEDWTVWEARAASLSLVDSHRLVMAALDRLIAEQSGGGG